MVEKSIGIDIGTTNVRIYKKHKGIVLEEPSLIAIDKETGEAIAYGYEAKRLLGRTPERIDVIRPIENGVIADFEMTERLLNYFLRKTHMNHYFLKPVVVMSCPLKITKVEENAFREAADRLGARDVYLVNTIQAVALGLGIDRNRPKGTMIINIGGGVTNIAIISCGSILKGYTSTQAGNTYDQKIISYMKQKYQLLIGEKTAEKIKIEGCAFYEGEKKIEVRGKDLITNLPHTMEISSADIIEALRETIYELIDNIKEVLEDVSPEIAADIASNGILLAGGGALLTGLDQLLSFELNIPVIRHEENAKATVEGLGILLENPRSLLSNRY